MKEKVISLCEPQLLLERICNVNICHPLCWLNFKKTALSASGAININKLFSSQTETCKSKLRILKKNWVFRGRKEKESKRKMQLDVEVSPPANDLQQRFPPQSLQLINYIVLVLGSWFRWSDKLFSSLNFSEVTDRRTDRRKAMHMSPTHICTDVLKTSWFLLTQNNTLNAKKTNLTQLYPENRPDPRP